MGENVLDIFEVDINCDTNSCALRYYHESEELAVGLIRFQHYIKEGKIPQRVVQIISMDIDNMISILMEHHNLKVQHGDLMVKTIRLDAQEKVQKHVETIVTIPS